jgi:hypothetical protein
MVGEEVLFRLILSPAVSPKSRVVVKCEAPQGITIRFSTDDVSFTSPESKSPQKLLGYFSETLECAIPKAKLNGTKQLRFKLEVTGPDGNTVDIPDTGTIECSITEIGSLSTS